ncbi:hypothetical protein J2S43_004437 [Catenuloplanes nepalensis]|uniref:Uncharacterized protein n=1 Tax=Catenuloplanes nepalensis TaxID=587533 RepID=A0ABT9MWV0_9ACTN|nr:hypothetical protein [Catenuloplanes nepalensis]
MAEEPNPRSAPERGIKHFSVQERGTKHYTFRG